MVLPGNVSEVMRRNLYVDDNVSEMMRKNSYVEVSKKEKPLAGAFGKNVDQKRESQEKEDAGPRKGRKVAKHCVFSMICGSGGEKVSSLKRRVRTHLARGKIKNCTPLWREAHFQVEMCKTHRGGTTSRSLDVEKVHALVARSAFPSQIKMRKTPQVGNIFGSRDFDPCPFSLYFLVIYMYFFDIDVYIYIYFYIYTVWWSGTFFHILGIVIPAD